MSSPSNSVDPKGRETVQVEDFGDEPEERICKHCHGLGSDPDYDDEIDCIKCEGWGSILI